MSPSPCRNRFMRGGGYQRALRLGHLVGELRRVDRRRRNVDSHDPRAPLSCWLEPREQGDGDWRGGHDGDDDAARVALEPAKGLIHRSFIREKAGRDLMNTPKDLVNLQRIALGQRALPL